MKNIIISSVILLCISLCSAKSIEHNVYDIRNNIINIDSLAEKSIIIFYSNPNCSSCCYILNDRINKLKLDSSIKIIYLVFGYENVIYRRSESAKLKKNYKLDYVFYDIPETSLATHYQAQHPPSILIKNGTNFQYFSHSELFDEYLTNKSDDWLIKHIDDIINTVLK